MYPVFSRSDYSWKRPLKSIRLFGRQIKWSIQRIKRGYSDLDCADVDVWFLNVFPDMLKDFRESVAGSCTGSFPVGYMLDFYEQHKDEIGVPFEVFRVFYCASDDKRLKKWQDDCCESCMQRWQDTLQEMERLFRKSDGGQYSWEYDNSEYRTECRRKAFTMLAECFEQLWD